MHYETIEYKGYNIQINQDDMAESPREWDNLGTIITFMRRDYGIGDNNKFSSSAQFRQWSKREKVVCLPVYAYIHSGITINTGGFSCSWDSGQAGYIYVTYEKIRKEYGIKRVTKKYIDKVTRCLDLEIKTFDQYLTGDTYYYTIEDKEGDHLDSCGGFFGTDWKTNGLLYYAENAIDCHVSQARKAHFNKLKAWIKNHVPMQYRECYQGV